MPITYIFGHRKPDTDSVVAAIALGFLYRKLSCFEYKNPRAVIVDPVNPETEFIFDKFQVDTPQQITAKDIKKDDQVVLVDHNEESQRLEDLDPEQIVDIIDHHKVNINLNKPIFMTFKNWGCSSTIVYYLMKQNDIKPDKTLASLMLAAVLSDTVGFKSATTTDKDREIGQELAEIAQIDDVEAFTLEIFKAKSSIGDMTCEEIVKNDFKIYEFEEKTFIGQIETVEQAELLKDKKDCLLKAMAKVKQEEDVEVLFLVVTDILKVNSKLLILDDDEEEAAEKAFGGKVKDGVLDIGPRMSRKKEIAPQIETALD